MSAQNTVRTCYLNEHLLLKTTRPTTSLQTYLPTYIFRLPIHSAYPCSHHQSHSKHQSIPTPPTAHHLPPPPGTHPHVPTFPRHPGKRLPPQLGTTPHVTLTSPWAPAPPCLYKPLHPSSL